MVLNLVIIGLAIPVNPLALVPFILILGSERGVLRGLALVPAWMAGPAYWVMTAGARIARLVPAGLH